jgi:hypothetical protein
MFFGEAVEADAVGAKALKVADRRRHPFTAEAIKGSDEQQIELAARGIAEKEGKLPAVIQAFAAILALDVFAGEAMSETGGRRAGYRDSGCVMLTRRAEYRDVLPTRSLIAASRTDSPLAIMLRARASFSALTTGLRPPLRPRDAAAESPARVRSRIRSRSNWPRAPKRWNTEPPTWCGGVDRLGDRAEPDTALFKRCYGFDQMHQRATEPVELPDDEYIARAHIVERLLQARPIGTGTGGSIVEHLAASRRGESIELQRRVLIEGANAHVAYECHELVHLAVRQSECPTCRQ